jgi:hypothetical protein
MRTGGGYSFSSITCDCSVVVQSGPVYLLYEEPRVNGFYVDWCYKYNQDTWLWEGCTGKEAADAFCVSKVRRQVL